MEAGVGSFVCSVLALGAMVAGVALLIADIGLNSVGGLLAVGGGVSAIVLYGLIGGGRRD